MTRPGTGPVTDAAATAGAYTPPMHPAWLAVAWRSVDGGAAPGGPAFVRRCLAACGVAGTDSASAASWLRWGEPLDGPRPGAVVVLRSLASDPAEYRVGFWVDMTPDAVRLLGADPFGAAAPADYALADYAVRAVRWPPQAPRGAA